MWVSHQLVECQCHVFLMVLNKRKSFLFVTMVGAISLNGSIELLQDL